MQLVKEVREKKEKNKSRQRFWEMAGSKMGEITGLTREEKEEAEERKKDQESDDEEGEGERRKRDQEPDDEEGEEKVRRYYSTVLNR